MVSVVLFNTLDYTFIRIFKAYDVSAFKVLVLNGHYKQLWTLQSITSRQVEVSLRETCAYEHPGNTWLSASPLPCPYSVSQRHQLLPSATLRELTAHSRSPFQGTFLIEMLASELLVWRGLWMQVYRTATPQECALGAARRKLPVQCTACRAPGVGAGHKTCLHGETSSKAYISCKPYLSLRT